MKLMTGRLVISVLCVAAFAMADSTLRFWRARSAATAPALRVIAAPQPLLPFAAADLDGRDMSPSTWHGRFVLVNFWATWCAPCRTEIPALITLQSKYPDRLQVVGVLVDQVSVDFVRAFEKSLRINYPTVISTSDIERAFGEVLVLPTSYLVDPDGRIVASNIGRIDAEAVGALISR